MLRLMSRTRLWRDTDSASIAGERTDRDTRSSVNAIDPERPQAEAPQWQSATLLVRITPVANVVLPTKRVMGICPGMDRLPRCGHAAGAQRDKSFLSARPQVTNEAQG